MGIDVYMLKWLAETKLSEARAQSARRALLRSIGGARIPVRAAVCAALIKAVRRLRRREGPRPRGGRLATLDAR